MILPACPYTTESKAIAARQAITQLHSISMLGITLNGNTRYGYMNVTCFPLDIAVNSLEEPWDYLASCN